MIKTYTLSEILESIYSYLDAVVPSERALVFDCDGTLIKGDISELTGHLLMKSGYVDQELMPEEFRNPSVYTKMQLTDFHRARKLIESQIGSEMALEWEVFIQAGLPEQLVIDQAHKAIKNSLETKHLEFTDVLPSLLKKYSQHSWIVSGSSRPTVVAIGECFSLDPARVLATRLELVDGIYQRKFADPGFVWEHNKVHVLEQKGVTSPDLVAGDSVGDWNMLQKSKKWVWCVLWGESNRRSQEFRKKIENHLGVKTPVAAGYYMYSWAAQNWVFEVKPDPEL